MDQIGEQSDGAPTAESPAEPSPRTTADSIRGADALRDWADALLIAFVLAMFLRIFLVELFKIPTGSMTPTLIGGEVAEVDFNGDGKTDLLLLNAASTPLLFLNDGGRLVGAGGVRLSWEEQERLARDGRIHTQYDRILVNKFAYWFRPPRRGDVVVFKVPDVIWEDDKPIFIKRCVGEPGETLSFDGEGRLLVDDKPVLDPPFFLRQRYATLIEGQSAQETPREIEFEGNWRGERKIQRIHVPRGQTYVFGDNTHSSRDSRYWGGVPLANLKGRAFFRYYPLTKMKFLNGQ